MTVKQLSVFLENTSGRINEVLNLLAENDINIVAMSLAESTDYGIVRFIVSDPEKAVKCLKENDMSARLTDVLCIRVPHSTGSLAKAMEILSSAKVNIDYMYAFANGNDASAVLRTQDTDRAIVALMDNGFSLYKAEEAYVANM